VRKENNVKAFYLACVAAAIFTAISGVVAFLVQGSADKDLRLLLIALIWAVLAVALKP
jgi:hypothetical protein